MLNYQSLLEAGHVVETVPNFLYFQVPFDLIVRFSQLPNRLGITREILMIYDPSTIAGLILTLFPFLFFQQALWLLSEQQAFLDIIVHFLNLCAFSVILYI